MCVLRMCNWAQLVRMWHQSATHTVNTHSCVCRRVCSTHQCVAARSCRSVSAIFLAMGWYLSPTAANVSSASFWPAGPERHSARYRGRRYCSTHT